MIVLPCFTHIMTELSQEWKLYQCYIHTFFLWWGGFLFDDCEEDTWSYDECHHEMSWHFLCINGSETKTLGPSQVVFKHLHCRCPLQPQQRHRRATATSHEGRDSCGDRAVVCCTDADSPSLGYLDTRQQRRHVTLRYTKTQKSLIENSTINLNIYVYHEWFGGLEFVSGILYYP